MFCSIFKNFGFYIHKKNGLILLKKFFFDLENSCKKRIIDQIHKKSSFLLKKLVEFFISSFFGEINEKTSPIYSPPPFIYKMIMAHIFTFGFNSK